jgi:hypothetical protein
VILAAKQSCGLGIGGGSNFGRIPLGSNCPSPLARDDISGLERLDERLDPRHYGEETGPADDLDRFGLEVPTGDRDSAPATPRSGRRAPPAATSTKTAANVA